MARKGRDEKLELLGRCPWAAGASARDLRWLGSVVDELRLPAGATVAGAAEVGRWTYYVASGALAVGEPASVAPAGSFVVTPAVGVVVLDEAELLVLPVADGPAIVARFPRLAEAFAPAP